MLCYDSLPPSDFGNYLAVFLCGREQKIKVSMETEAISTKFIVYWAPMWYTNLYRFPEGCDGNGNTNFKDFFL